ncbi:MAG: hypothetical protein SWC96_13170 [Thermodesulfobacteriota bacterium]|nr:hypothetical protein [Thermodesulfobacteriota bacterium]
MEDFPHIKRPLPFGIHWRITRSQIAGLLILLLLIVMLVVIVSIGTARYFYKKMPDRVSYQLRNTVEAGISDWIPVEATAEKAIPVKLSKILETDIPISQDLNVWIDEDLTVPLDVMIPVPIDQEIFVEARVPVETEIPLEGVRVQTSFLGMKISVPLSGFFPVNMVVPLKGPIHVKTQANVHLQQDVTVHINKRFIVPLNLNVPVRLPIDDVFKVNLPDNIRVRARLPEKVPVDVQWNLEIPK